MWTYDYEYGTEDELYHHGILGMRWGIRRYQNADGSLTAAGRKRRTQLEGELSKLPLEKKSEDSTGHATSSTTKPKHKSVNDMSDDELANATRRLQAEKNYLDLQRQVSSLTPQQKSKGREFAENFGNTLVDNLRQNVSRSLSEWANKQIRDALGLDNTPEARLKKEVDILDLKVKRKESLDKLNKKESPDKKAQRESDDLKRRAENEKNRRTIDEVERYFKRKAAEDAAQDHPTQESGPQNSETQDSRTQARQETRENNGQTNVNGGSSTNQTRESSDDSRNTYTYTGNVRGEGASRGSSNDDDFFSRSNVVDVDYRDVNSGQEYVQYLLGEANHLDKRK